MAKKNKTYIAHLDAKQLNKKKGFISELEREFNFPSYFGKNLDAVWDCMTDLSWLPYDEFHLKISSWKATDKKPDFNFKEFLLEIKDHWEQGENKILFKLEYL